MDWILQQLNNMEWGTILVVGAMFWLFKNNQDSKFKDIRDEFKDFRKEIHEELKEIRIEMREEIKEVGKEVQEIRTSLNRMEGAFYSKEYCMLKEGKEQRAAEK